MATGERDFEAGDSTSRLENPGKLQTARRGRTRERLMAAGEQLIGRKGINGVSLEEIARAGGQANKYAVQYHFGGREGLVQQILDTRLAAVEARRAEMLAEDDPRDVIAIVAAFVRPLAELGADGSAFPRFLLQFATQFEPWPDVVHPLERAETGGATLTLFGRLCAALPSVPPRRLGERLPLLMHLPLRTIVADADRPAGERENRLDDLIRMIAAALAAGGLPADGLTPQPHFLSR